MNQPATTNEQALQAPESDRLATLDLVKTMSRDSQLDPNAFLSTVMRTCFDVQITKEQFLAFLMVAKEYQLNPLTKEIYGFASRGKVVPIVGVDGWLKMINERPELDGIEYVDHRDERGNVEAIECIIYRKDRERPVKVTEYMQECRMKGPVWDKWPIRMLRHKATIQAARVAFGFSGIYDPDEGARIQQGESDLVGHATVVPEDAPTDAAGAILSKIVHKDEEMEFAPPVEPQAVSEPIFEQTDAEPTPEAMQSMEAGTVAVEDIPGVTKGSEVKPPKKKAAAKSGKKPPEEQTNEEYLADLEAGEDNNALQDNDQ